MAGPGLIAIKYLLQRRVIIHAGSATIGRDGTNITAFLRCTIDASALCFRRSAQMAPKALDTRFEATTNRRDRPAWPDAALRHGPCWDLISGDRRSTW